MDVLSLRGRREPYRRMRRTLNRLRIHFKLLMYYLVTAFCVECVFVFAQFYGGQTAEKERQLEKVCCVHARLGTCVFISSCSCTTW